MDTKPKAIGLIQEDLPRQDVDMHLLALGHGYSMVYTVHVRTGLFHTMFAIARHAAEYNAQAVVVPSLGHADHLRQYITDNAALITPTGFYPRGHRWESECQPH